jgi:complement component 1 Q subcomponent-binding protein
MDGVDSNGEAIDGVSPPCITTTCLLSKSASPKSLLIDLGAHPDGFEITNVAIYDKALAEKTGADADWTRRSLYMGPHYDTLDTSVQDAFAGFLAERGVDEALCKSGRGRRPRPRVASGGLGLIARGQE